MKKEKREFCIGWWLVFITMLLLFACSFFAASKFTENNYYLSLLLAESLLLIPIMIGTAVLKPGQAVQKIGFHRFSPVLIPLAALLPICLQSFAGFLLMPLNHALNALFQIGQKGALPIPENTAEYITAIITVVIWSPLLEEILCRGILTALFEKYGSAVSVIFTALAFSLLHFDPSNIAVMFCLGLLLGIIRLSGGSVWICVIAHAANNLAAFLTEVLPSMPENTYITVTIAEAVIFPVLLIAFFKLTPSRERLTAQRTEKSQIGFSLGAALTIGVYLSYAVLLIVTNLMGMATGVTYRL